MPISLPQPRSNAEGIEFWTRAKAGRLALRECAACGAKHYPPRHLCPNCWSEQLCWVDASGSARVYTFTVMHRAPLPEFAPAVPYVVALVDLAEGPRMMANIVGKDALQVEIGEPVELCFERRGEYRLPQFRRVQRA